MPGPFVYQPYRNPYVNSISQLMQQQGQIPAEAALQAAQAQANATLQSGQAWGNAAQNIGQSVAAIPQQMQQGQMRNLQMQDIAGQVKERNALAASRDAATKGLATVDNIMQTSMDTDPDTGVTTFNRAKFEKDLAASGNGHLYPQYAEMLDKLDASAAKRNAEARTILAQGLYAIQQHGYSPESAFSVAAYLKANGIATNQHLAPALSAIMTNPTPENIRGIVDQLSVGLPEYQTLVQADEKRKAELAHTQAQTASESAAAAKTTAEVQGTLPRTPSQLETERHNQATEAIAKLNAGREAASARETARHNLEMERLQNPFGAASVSQVTGQPSAPGQASPIASGTEGPTGDAFLRTLDPAIAAQVKAYAEGRQPFPTGMSSYRLMPLIKLVTQYDPTFDAANYNARNKARTDLTSPSGTGGKQITALNTAVQHLDQLRQASEALNNGNIQLYNRVANALATQFGYTGKTDFDTIAPKVADEVERLWRGSGGSEGSIERTLGALNSNMAPGQLRSAIGKTADLIEGRLTTLEQQRDQVLGQAGKDIQVIFPNSERLLTNLKGGGSVTVKAPNGKSYTFSSQAEADAKIAAAKASGVWK